MDLLVQAYAALLQLPPARHLSFLELGARLVEVFPFFIPALLLLLLPLLLVTVHVGALLLGPILPTLLLEGPELRVQLPIRPLGFLVQAYPALLQISPARHQTLLKVVSLFVEELPLFGPAPLLLRLPLLLVTVQVLPALSPFGLLLCLCRQIDRSGDLQQTDA